MTYQQPVLDRGGRRTREGTERLGEFTSVLRLAVLDEEASSFGAMIGNRSGCFPDDVPPRLFGITSLVTVIRSDQLFPSRWKSHS